MGFALVHLAVGKLPKAGQVRAIGPQGQQKRSVALDHGRHNDHDRRHSTTALTRAPFNTAVISVPAAVKSRCT